jgi:hypothetical protein
MPCWAMQVRTAANLLEPPPEGAAPGEVLLPWGVVLPEEVVAAEPVAALLVVLAVELPVDPHAASTRQATAASSATLSFSRLGDWWACLAADTWCSLS